MLIYHITDNQLYCTEVVIGAMNSKVNHFCKCGVLIPTKHQENVKKLRNGQEIYVTGATYHGADYDGMFLDRLAMAHYLDGMLECS